MASKAVVFARTVKPEWLDKTVEIVLKTQDQNEFKDTMNEYLSQYIESSTNLRKTREILNNTWLAIGEDNQRLREKALAIYQLCPHSERLAVHWAMLLLAFPVFRDLCAIIGKLADGQQEIATAQITRRFFEIWGERSTLVHSLSKNIQTLKYFGVLEQVKPGRYQVVKRKITNKDAACLLVYAVLKTSGKLYHSFLGIDKFKELFPFIIDIGIDDLQQWEMFRLDRIGGETVVSIVE